MELKLKREYTCLAQFHEYTQIEFQCIDGHTVPNRNEVEAKFLAMTII